MSSLLQYILFASVPTQHYLCVVSNVTTSPTKNYVTIPTGMLQGQLLINKEDLSKRSSLSKNGHTNDFNR